MQSVAAKEADTEIYHEIRGNPKSVTIVWAHGWGQSHESFLPLSGSFENMAYNLSLDFPGFGKSPPPADSWDTAEYADEVAEFLRTKTNRPVIWVGHSFGCRVGVQMAARHPDLIQGLFLIAAAGLPRRRPLHKKLYIKGRIKLYKFLKKLIPFGLKKDWLKSKFGSIDYKNASGIMRNVFIKTVNENLSEVARRIECPVVLVYGQNDNETPPEIGRRYAALIENSEMVEMAGHDHYTILSSGRHQVAALLKNFLNDLKNK